MLSQGLERLKAACDMSLQKRSVSIPGGGEFVYWMTPLTITQRRAAEKAAGPKGSEQDTGLQILIAKAMNEDGQPLFTVADLRDLKTALPASVLTDLMVQIINGEGGEVDDGEVQTDDPKGSKESSGKTKN